jgi:hypothetical protein
MAGDETIRASIASDSPARHSWPAAAANGNCRAANYGHGEHFRRSNTPQESVR